MQTIRLSLTVTENPPNEAQPRAVDWLFQLLSQSEIDISQLCDIGFIHGEL